MFDESLPFFEGSVDLDRDGDIEAVRWVVPGIDCDEDVGGEEE
jgi:hypothetical protein